MPGFSKLELSITGQHAVASLQQFSSLRAQGLLCDCVLCCDDMEFPVHRALLAASSPYFCALFTARMRESTSPRVTISGVAATTFEVLLDFVYAGNVKLNEDNILAVFSGAELLQLHDLRGVCIDYFINQLCATNCLGIWRYATSYHCTQLESIAWRYITSHFSEVAQTEEFAGLSESDVCTIFGSGDLEIHTELDVWQAMCTWVLHDAEARSSRVSDLMVYIRFPLLSTKALSSLVTTSQPNCFREPCREAITQARNAQRLRSTKSRQKKSAYKKESITRRPGSQALGVVGGYNAGFVRQGEMYDEEGAKWQNKDLDVADSGCKDIHWIGAIGLRVYALAGNSLSCIDKVMSRFTSSAAKLLQSSALEEGWECEAMLPQDCSSTQVCIMDECMYLYGETAINDAVVFGISRYDPSTGVWEYLSTAPHARVNVGLTAYKGRLFIVGGLDPDSGEIGNNFTAYDPVADSWESLPPCRVGRYHAGIAVLSDELYLTGGIGDEGGVINTLLASVERFSFKASQWSPVSSLHEPRSGMAACAWKGKIVAVGGETDSTVHTDTVEELDPETGSWSLSAPLNCGRLYPCMVVVS